MMHDSCTCIFIPLKQQTENNLSPSYKGKQHFKNGNYLSFRRPGMVDKLPIRSSFNF